jgi:DNA-binding response OmpR family regulator
MKLLVVDDDTEFAATLTERLRLHQIEAESVHSGEEVMDTVSEFTPDVIILDMSGINLLAKIKTFDPTIEVILLTGHVSIDAGITGMELGAFDYITKPVDLTELIKKSTEAYDNRQNTISRPD